MTASATSAPTTSDTGPAAKLYHRVEGVLRENILAGRLPPGFVLLEGAIAGILQTSRAPVQQLVHRRVLTVTQLTELAGLVHHRGVGGDLFDERLVSGVEHSDADVARLAGARCQRRRRDQHPAEQLDSGEVFYPLHVRVCGRCLLVQLPAYIPAEDIFSHYAYFSSYSDSWVAHAKAFVEDVVDRLSLDGQSPDRPATREAFFGADVVDVPVRTRASVGTAPEPGPMLVDEYDTTVVVRPGWTVRRDEATETLILERRDD